jgi:hypothetical protein
MFAASNQLADLVPLVPDVLVVLNTIQADDVVEVRTSPGTSFSGDAPVT